MFKNRNKFKNFLITASTIIATTNFAYADVAARVDGFFAKFLNIFLVFVKWGGIFSLGGLAIFLYVNNDETGAKRGKIAMIVILIATIVAWLAQPFIQEMTTGI